ncbi:MAG: response regulator [Magnetococcus sp. DMHC-6]
MDETQKGGGIPFHRVRQLLETIDELTTILLATHLELSQRELVERIRQSVFSLTTLAEVDPVASSVTTVEEPVKIGLRLLLAEDNVFTQKLMVRVLEIQGHQVSVVDNGQQALDRLEQENFDLLLLDLRMPGMDGFETVRSIRRREAERSLRRLPIVAVTALPDDIYRAQALEAGVDGYYGKPVQVEELFSEMQRVIHLARQVPVVSSSSAQIDHELADLKCLIKTVEGDRFLMREVLDLYFKDAPRQIALIEKAIQNQNAAVLQDAAHSLKGASGAFGYESQVYTLSFNLENMGRLGQLAGAREELSKLRQAILHLEIAGKKMLEVHKGENNEF